VELITDVVTMRVIKPSRINEFAKKYPETKNALQAWYKASPKKYHKCRLE
jgi:mRNA-degrading endonuclease HigB of HigAB toxin-antitoxin module